jgi:hypothetical protein
VKKKKGKKEERRQEFFLKMKVGKKKLTNKENGKIENKEKVGGKKWKQTDRKEK